MARHTGEGGATAELKVLIPNLRPYSAWVSSLLLRGDLMDLCLQPLLVRWAPSDLSQGRDAGVASLTANTMLASCPYGGPPNVVVMGSNMVTLLGWRHTTG